MKTITSQLAGSNIDARDQVIDKIIKDDIQVFHTQRSLYRLIEDIKFPHLKNSPWRKDTGNDYSPNNYFPIVRWMLDRGLLTKIEQTNRIVYLVNPKIYEEINMSTVYQYEG